MINQFSFCCHLQITSRRLSVICSVWIQSLVSSKDRKEKSSLSYMRYLMGQWWSWATELQLRWFKVCGMRCNLRRKPWQPTSSQVWWWAWLCNGAQHRDTWANTQPCWEKVGSCLWLPGSQCHAYFASGVKVVLLGCAALMCLVVGFFRRVFKFPLTLKKKKRVKLS